MQETSQLRVQPEPEPIILTTDPEEVAWSSLIFAAVITLLAIVLTRGLY